jgi:hypothetical protein
VSGGWIGVDLDGTLAHYDRWRGPEHVGAPVRRMRRRVVDWLAEGRDVRIFTARTEGSYPAIRRWCVMQFHRELPITNVKDFGMVRLYDDRAVTIEANTGRIICAPEE